MSERRSGKSRLVVKNGGIVVEQRASLGRIVIYQHPENGSQSPAIIQGLQALEGGETLRLCVFSQLGPVMESDVRPGTGPGQWSWPPRV